MSIFADDKYQDRAWDWAKDMSKITSPGWQQLYRQSLDATTQGKLTPWSQGVFDFSQQAMAPYTQQQNPLQSDVYRNLQGLYSQWENPQDITGSKLFQDLRGLYSQWENPQNVTESDIFRNLQGLYDPWAQATDPFQSDLYKGAEGLYQQTVEPLYAQLAPELRRGIEGQYGQAANQALATGVRGGALADMLSSAAMGRAESLGDMERGLRSQDIARLDQTQRERAAALSGIAQNIYNTQQAGMMNRAGALMGLGQSLEGMQQAGMQNRANQLTGLGQQMGQQDLMAQLTRADMLGKSGLALDQMYGNRGMMANQYMSGLLNQLAMGDADRAQNMANVGVQGRYLTGNQLSQSEAGTNAGIFGGLMNMGSMLGLGLGASGGLGDIFGGLGGLFGGGGSSPMSVMELNGYGF